MSLRRLAARDTRHVMGPVWGDARRPEDPVLAGLFDRGVRPRADLVTTFATVCAAPRSVEAAAYALFADRKRHRGPRGEEQFERDCACLAWVAIGVPSFGAAERAALDVALLAEDARDVREHFRGRGDVLARLRRQLRQQAEAGADAPDP